MTMFDWPASSPTLIYIKNLWGLGHYQSNLGIHNTTSVAQSDSFRATQHWSVQKGPNVVVVVHKWTYFCECQPFYIIETVLIGLM